VLAAKIVQGQGIETILLNFVIPFCNVSNYAGQSAQALGLELRKVDIAEDFLEVLKNPRYGFGSNMNPCIDCKILMLRKAAELMKEWGASFIVTGEVLGQRPMSQHRQALNIIENRSGLEGLILRPLSAKLLDETLPEKEGWVNRSKLFNLSGRSRKPQIELAKNFRIKDYANPAGGCLLTDAGFAKRLEDLLTHNEMNIKNIELLKVGRHFRITESAKLAVGRDERENNLLEKLAEEDDYLFMPKYTAGPVSLGRGAFNSDLIRLCCAIASRYCDRNGNSKTDIVYRKQSSNIDSSLSIAPIKELKLKSLRI